MGLLDFLKGRKKTPVVASSPKWDVIELGRRLEIDLDQLRGMSPRYHQFKLTKRSGGQRLIAAPDVGGHVPRTLHMRMSDGEVMIASQGYQKAL